MILRRYGLAALAASALVAGGRAAVVAQDLGYVDAGAWSLAWTATAPVFLLSFALALPLALVAARLWTRVADRPRAALLVPLVAGPLLAALIGAPWPLGSANSLGLYDADGRTALLGAALLALVGLSLLSPGVPRRVAAIPAALGVLAGLGALAVFLPGESARWPERPNLVLVSIDTQRPDHLSCYGYERPTSPNIDRFAERAVRFTRAFTPYPWTLLSHMSMFTSLNPTAHGVTPYRPLAGGVPTLAEHLREAGYRTVGILDDVTWLDPKYRFDRGFDVYEQIRGDATAKLERLEPVLDHLGDGPFFLFLHFFDVHSDTQQLPYESLEDYRRLFAGDYEGDFTGCTPALGCASRLLTAMSERNLVLEGEDLEYLIGLYDAGVRTFDRRFGELVDLFEERGLFETTVVVLTSDHGEAFFEHGKPLHQGIHDEVVRIPLIVRTPGVREGRADDSLVSVVDLAPTLLELCGVEPAGMEGISFRHRLVEGAPAPAEVRDWIVLEDGRDRWHGFRTERWKGIRYEDERWQLYDLLEDPGEQRDLVRLGAEIPAEVVRLRERYETERERMLELQRGRVDAGGAEATAAEAAELEALGYAAELGGE